MGLEVVKMANCLSCVDVTSIVVVVCFRITKVRIDVNAFSE